MIDEANTTATQTTPAKTTFTITAASIGKRVSIVLNKALTNVHRASPNIRKLDTKITLTLAEYLGQLQFADFSIFNGPLNVTVKPDEIIFRQTTDATQVLALVSSR